jgi:hypothetical protein
MTGENNEVEYIPTRAGKNSFFETETFYKLAEQVFDLVHGGRDSRMRFSQITARLPDVDRNVLNLTLKRLRESSALEVETLGHQGIHGRGRYQYFAASRSKANLRPTKFCFEAALSNPFFQKQIPDPGSLPVKSTVRNFLEPEDQLISEGEGV